MPQPTLKLTLGTLHLFEALPLPRALTRALGIARRRGSEYRRKRSADLRLGKNLYNSMTSFLEHIVFHRCKGALRLCRTPMGKGRSATSTYLCERTCGNHLTRASKGVSTRPPSCSRQQSLAEAALMRVCRQSGMQRPGLDVMQHTMTCSQHQIRIGAFLRKQHLRQLQSRGSSK